MKVRMIGCSHHTTPIEVRERIAFSAEQYSPALAAFRDTFPESESVLLNTCNRVEWYVAAAADKALPSSDDMIAFIAAYHQVDAELFRKHFHSRDDDAAIDHLFGVVSSVDSIVLGESQIAAQVSEAYERSRMGGFAGSILHTLFQRANAVSKRVFSETEIHRRRVSIPSVAVSEIASEFFERFDDKQVVVIGSGEMGVETLQYLIGKGTSQITVVNRSIERARDVAEKFQIRVQPWESLDPLLVQADLVVSTTGAQEPIVTEIRMRNIMQQRRKGTLLILDLAVPRDFEPSIARLPSVFLYSIDDLQSVCQRNESFRRQQLPKARRIIEEERQRLKADWEMRSSSETIRALREQANLIREAELQRLLGKQALHGASLELQQEVAQALERVVNKLLHFPLQSLREAPHEEQRDSLVTAIRKLFRI
jgi:glutamyl-tRNA reductase